MNHRSAFIAVLVLVPQVVWGQAWLPQRGSGTFSFFFEGVQAGDHLLSSTELGGVDFGTNSVDFGDVHSLVFGLSGDYAVHDRLALGGKLVHVSARYTEGGRADESPAPHQGLPVDDGSFHGSFQDAQVSLRFAAVRGVTAVAPSITFVFPLADYKTLGHASLGRGLNELALGLQAGTALFRHDEVKAYLHGEYSYSFVEKLGDTTLDRSNGGIELGYFLTPRVTLSGFTNAQVTHGGLDWSHGIHGPEDFHAHDVAAAADWVRLGVGASGPLGLGRATVRGVLTFTVWGENTHAGKALSVATTWPVGA